MSVHSSFMGNKTRIVHFISRADLNESCIRFDQDDACNAILDEQLSQTPSVEQLNLYEIL